MDKHSVLFVDDDPNILSGLKRVLRSQRKNWHLIFTDGGEKALELMQQSEVDVIVSDMLMPGMNGCALFEKISKQYPGVIRIMLSGQTSRTNVAKSILNSHLFLSKPCPIEYLINTLERVRKIKEILKSNKANLRAVPRSFIPNQVRNIPVVNV